VAVDRIWSKIKIAAQGGGTGTHHLNPEAAKSILQEICDKEGICLPQDAFDYFVRELVRLSDPVPPNDSA
jgi:hypothetical protein